MPAAGRIIEVDGARLPGWVERFAERHGPPAAALVEADPRLPHLHLSAPDGATAGIAIPFAPLPPLIARSPTAGPDDLVAAVRDHLSRPRTVGVLLVRRTGWAAGVVVDQVLVDSRVGGGHVQGRTKAGGWSQQRFARRRTNQALQVYERASNGAAAVLGARSPALAAVITGGDRAGVAAVLADPRLAGLGALVEPRFLDVGDPTRAVLADAARRLQTVVITLNELA